MTRLPSRLLHLLLAGSSLLLPSFATAQEVATKASAVQLFDQADRLMAEGQISAACLKYGASVKLDPQLGALLHLADCYAQNGQIASAWASFRDAEELARERGDERAALARDRAKVLEPRLSRLTVSIPIAASLPGLEVRVDGQPLTNGAWGIATPIDPGSHGIEARAPGHEAWSSSVDVTGDQQEIRVQIPLLTKRETSAPPAAAPTRPRATPLRSTQPPNTLRTLGWTSAGAGVVALGVGAVLVVNRNGKLDERKSVCPILDAAHCSQAQEEKMNTLASEANTQSRLSKIAFVGGGVLLAGGVAAILLAPQPPKRTDSAWLLPAVGPNVVGFNGGARW